MKFAVAALALLSCVFAMPGVNLGDTLVARQGSGLPVFPVGTQTGDGTFSAAGLGRCGVINTDSQHVVAVSSLIFDNFPGFDGVNSSDNPICGRTITASFQGKSVVVTITGACTGCAFADLDFSVSAFEALADPSVGRIHGMTWVMND